MDRFIAAFDGVADADLVLCERQGVAYQADMTITAAYDESYFDKCAGYEGSAIADRINAGRIALVDRYAGISCGVLDIGVGSGEFVRRRPNTFGFDINPRAVAWLKDCKRWSDKFCAFDAFTFWDVIEHVPEPEQYFSRVPKDAFLFASIPIFGDLKHIRESRHYRPGEHLYYFTEQGFIDWMARHGFLPIERSRFETEAGRDSIESFAFRHVGEVARRRVMGEPVMESA